MARQHIDDALDYRRKDRMKKTKVILQIIILIIIGYLLFQALFHPNKYKEPNKNNWHNENGFIALSYFGVDRTGSPKLIAKKQLEKQLEALHDQGYQTISQSDILDFYHKGKPLPAKALFLSFEDGRNDSSLYAYPLLEKFNYKATFLSYANKMGVKDNKFVQAKEMLRMKKTGYWELGTNGYRLSYINVFDKDGYFLGEKTEEEISNKTKIGHYNHYLMDFIRDENMIPTENRKEMEHRIRKDYSAMRNVYKDSLGSVPGLYMIMHANALNNGMNRLVEDVNNEEIKSTFNMNFNREGNMLNDRKGVLYDLTRVQPQPYWYTNHLLMKIKKDTKQRVQFINGDPNKAKKWDELKGAAEFENSKIALTSTPGSEGLLLLKKKEDLKNFQLNVDLIGNVVGKQSIYMRYDRKKNSFLRVTLNNNVIEIDQKMQGKKVERLYTNKLPVIKWEDKDLALEKATTYTREQSVAGVRREEEDYPLNIQKKRNLKIDIENQKVTIKVDGDTLSKTVKLDSSLSKGGVALGSEAHEKSEEDNIYDGVFDNLIIQAHKNGNEYEVFNSKPSGVEKFISKITEWYNRSIDWAIDTF
ncbi:polysaccharide deacetylase family protein [Bacillus sp. 1P06AnD]|uniref:polysaccharide deacetylase family protein n=1 Tax=Bacillus sp. 1P06AnD TaxID=3132208 RepID=UPI0039A0E1C5